MILICNLLLEMLEYIERRLFSDGKPVNSTVSLINQDFRVAGEIMAMSILQGGPLFIIIYYYLNLFRNGKNPSVLLRD